MEESDLTDFEEISRLADEGEQVDQLYALFNEEKKIEYLQCFARRIFIDRSLY